MLFVLTLVGTLFLAIWSTLNVRYALLGQEPGKRKWNPTFLLGGSYLTISLYLGLCWFVLWYFNLVRWPTSQLFWFSLLITVIINISFEILRFRAYTLAPLALITPFAAVSPAITVFTSWFILRELPSPGALFGIAIIVVSIYLLHLQDKFSLKNFFKPFQNIWNNRGVRLAFLSSLPPALSIVFDKKAVLASDPFSFSFLAMLFISLGALLIELVFSGRKKFTNQVRIFPWGQILLISFFAFVANITLNMAFWFTAVANVSALRRLVIIFEVALGYFILNQKEDIKKRLLVSLVVVIGTILIIFFK